MRQAPLVSVVIPAYQCAGSIGRALDSALSQEVPVELLVIDDCSTDNLDQVMAAYTQFPQVKYLKNSANLGAAESRNRAVSLANAPYVAFLDADDVWAPDKLHKQLAVLERTKAVLCCTARELLTPEGKPTGKVIPVKETITYRELLKHNSINCSSVVMPTQIAKEFPMEHAESHEDYIMWLRILKKYGSAQGINEPLLGYRLSTTGKSGNKLKSAKMTFMVYRHMGFGIGKSILCFCSYTLHGIHKYLFSKRKK